MILLYLKVPTFYDITLSFISFASSKNNITSFTYSLSFIYC